jgi:hypothetical protein
MHLQPGASMGNQGSRSGEGNLTKSAAKTPGQISHERIPNESERLRGQKRLSDPPERRGVKRREIVREEAKQAMVYFDLTAEYDGQRPLKIRRVGPQKSDITDALTTDSTSPQITPQPKIESPGAGNLIECTISSSGSRHEDEIDNIQRNGSHITSSDDFYNFGEEDSEADYTSEAHQKPKNMPFVDEGYGSFTTSQEWSDHAVELSEADLAEQLINFDNLRSTRDRLDINLNEISMPETSALAKKNALACKERIEREGVAKSKALREAARNQNGHTIEQYHDKQGLESSPKPPKYTSHEVNILSLFGRADKINGLRARDSNTHTNSGGTSTLSGSENGNEDDAQFDKGDDMEDLFYDSREPTPNTEMSSHSTQNHAKFDAEETQPESTSLTPVYSRHKDDPGPQTGNEKLERQLCSSKLGRPACIEIEDLEAASEKLEAYTKLNERQKAGPKTLFTPRHKLDRLNRSYQQTLKVDSSSPAPQRFYSPFAESVRRASSLSRKYEEASGEPQGLVSPVSKQDALIRAPNRYGGLAMLAEKARVESDALMSNLPRSFTNGSQHGEVERRYRSTTISASEFQADFSSFKRTISQEERDIITRHEWLKERQRALKTLQATYVEAARVSCITGVTEVMENELPKVDEFKKIVLEQGKIDRPRRTRVLNIKANMVRRQTREVPDDFVESHLGMLIDWKDRQKMADELKIVDEELDIVGNERRRDRNKTQIRKKKEVRFVSPDAQGGTSTPRARIPGGNVNNLAAPSKVTRPKFGTEEYRQSQSDAYWKSQKQREDALLEKLNNFDRPNAQTTSDGATVVEKSAGKAMCPTEEDAPSEVSGEDAGGEMFANMGVSSSQPVSKAAPAAMEISLEEMQRLDEERKQQEMLALPQPVPKATDGARASGQAPDAALAEKMRRAHLGIPEQEESFEILSDAESETSENSDDSDVQMVINYVVYGRYTGVAELEDCAKYRLGRFLKKDNAETLIGEKVVEFCSARMRDIAAATEAGDEERLAQLGDPEAGTLKHDMKTKEQIVEYPASSCRIGMELERVEARSRAEKEAVVATTTFVALYQRTMSDGSIETPSWDELVTCSGPNGVWLANKEACRIMGDWYAEHMKDGYLAMQRDALEEKVQELGDEGLFEEEDEFAVPGGVEKMEVWVDWKRNRG